MMQDAYEGCLFFCFHFLNHRRRYKKPYVMCVKRSFFASTMTLVLLRRGKPEVGLVRKGMLKTFEREIRLWLKNEISSGSWWDFCRTRSFKSLIIGVVKLLDIRPISAKIKRAFDGRFLTTLTCEKCAYIFNLIICLHFHNIAQQQITASWSFMKKLCRERVHWTANYDGHWIEIIL